MKYPLATSSWNDKEVNSAIEVLLSGNCSMGPITEDFEKKFAQRMGSKYAVFCNSGSSANLLALSALLYRKHGLNLSAGDEIIVPAVSWSTTYSPIHQIGCSLKFVDINLHTLNIDYKQIENAISLQTKAIVVVNLLGNPAHLYKIKKICDKNNLIMIEDNCESMGATYNKKEAGTFGVMGTYSLFFSHHLCSIEGGVVCTDDEELYEIIKCIRAHGWLRNLPEKNTICNKTGNHFEDSFKFVLPGYNLRPNDVFSAIGIEQLAKLDSIIEGRRNNAEAFKEKMSELHESDFYGKGNIIFQSQESESESSHFGFSMILDKQFSGQRAHFIKRLTEMNIETRPIVAGNFANNPMCSIMKCSTYGSLVNAEKIDKDGFFIGNSHKDLTEEITYFAECMKTIIKEL